MSFLRIGPSHRASLSDLWKSLAVEFGGSLGSDEDVPAVSVGNFSMLLFWKVDQLGMFFFVDVFVAGGKGAALRVEVVLPQIWVKCYIDVNDRTRVDVYF
jgi:hypothetical protein